MANRTPLCPPAHEDDPDCVPAESIGVLPLDDGDLIVEVELTDGASFRMLLTGEAPDRFRRAVSLAVDEGNPALLDLAAGQYRVFPRTR